MDKLDDDCGFTEPLFAQAQVVSIIPASLLLLLVTLLTEWQLSLAVLQSAHIALPPPYTLSGTHRQFLRKAYDEALEDSATKHVANIVNDGFGFTEHELDSALARADQMPYEALFEGAQQSEMNDIQHLWLMFVDTRKTWQKLQDETNEKAKIYLI